MHSSKKSALLGAALLVAIAAAAAPQSRADHHNFEFVVDEWVVDFLRPTVPLRPRAAHRVTPFKIPDENRKSAILVNGEYPGTTIEVYENDTVSINVVNNMISEATSIHWHGIHPFETPWTDGTVGVSQAPIGPGHNFTYTFRAWPAGTHYWHSHMDGMQSARGLRGPFIIKKREPEPQIPAYDEEKVLVLADEWRDPAVCLKLEGAMAGNDVCSDIDYASLNGQVAWGNMQRPDLSKYPYPLVEVEQGKCYRLRMIMMASNAENYIVSFAGHNATLVALDGVSVEPIQVTDVNMHIGERADVVLCADQAPGYYPIELKYDYACALTPGNFIPPGFHAVSSCKFYAFIHYANHTEWPWYGPPKSPKGTGGGKSPKPVAGVPFDLTNAADWHKTQPMKPDELADEPDVRYVIDLGLKGPLYSAPTDAPLTRGRWYMDIDGRRWSWKKPETPTLHTKNKCGNAGVPILDIPETAETVEIILNNLSPTAHNIHLHGMLFNVINMANFEWCNVNKTACFLMPKQINPCPAENRRFADDNHTGGIEDLYWGCAYNDKTDKQTRNLTAPLRKDSFQLWQRSWAVIRFKANFPGVWQFHCHMEQHIPLGMIMGLNVLPSKQQPIPKDVPTEGPCPVWSSVEGRATGGDAEAVQQLVDSKKNLEERVRYLESQLATESDAAQRCLQQSTAGVASL